MNAVNFIYLKFEIYLKFAHQKSVNIKGMHYA